MLRRHTGGNWPETADVTSGPSVLTLESIGFTTSLSAFYRTTGLAAQQRLSSLFPAG